MITMVANSDKQGNEYENASILCSLPCLSLLATMVIIQHQKRFCGLHCEK
jgi:hypothetical protein